MRLPEYCRDNVRRVHQILYAFLVEHEGRLTPQEIAQRTDISLERIAWSLEHTPEQISIDNPDQESSGRCVSCSRTRT